MKRVMMVGSAEQSGGGVSSVIKLMKKMPVWEKYRCYWLGTQIQRNYLWKLWYAVKAAVIAPFIMWRYDIVHFHTVPDKICLIVQMPELLCAKLYGKKVIMHIHMGNQLNDHTENGLFKWCLRRADRVVLLAKKWQRLFEEKFSDIDVPTSVVYNACDTSKEEQEVQEVQEGQGGQGVQKVQEVQGGQGVQNMREKSIIMAGYFDDNKAPNLLIEAWAALKDRYPDWRLTLMGNGDVDRFKMMAHEKGLDDCVSFPGYLTGERKKDVWDKASILCLCSYNEGFPMVVLEAWTHGIAVISTPVGGLPDVIEEGKNCLTFPFGDSKALAAQLEKLINNEALRIEMGEYSKKFVTDKFSLESVNTDLEYLYESL